MRSIGFGFGVVLTLMSLAVGQQTRIVSFTRDGTLTWTNAQTDVFCGLEYTESWGAGWEAAPDPFWNILVTNPVMTVELPLSEIDAKTIFFRLASATNLLVRSDTYDVDSQGIPRFVGSDYIELSKIEQISRFRSGEGHDYSDDFESCRSMKHYYQPRSTVDWASVQIRSPVAGTVRKLTQEWAGTQVEIQSEEYPAFRFILFHLQPSAPLSVGVAVSAGQLLGTHVGNQTMSDIAVGVNTPGGWKLVSYFDVMTDALFATYSPRGLRLRAEAIISKAARDGDPLTCQGQTFGGPGHLPNWVLLQ